MDTFTVMPVLVVLIVAIANAPTDIYSINAWNVGTLKVEPWRTRTSGIGRAVASSIAWIGRLWRSRTLRMCAAVALALLVVHVTSAHASVGILAAIVPATGAREIREQREKLIRDAGDLMGPNNVFATDEKRSQFDQIMVDVDTLGVALEDADRGEKFAAMQRQTLPESQRSADRPSERQEGGDDPAAKALYEKALGLYMRGVSMGDMAPEQRSALQTSYRSFSAEHRDMVTTSGANGGFLVAPDTRFYGSIIMAMKFFGGMEAAGAEVINTDTAGPMPITMGDDTGNVGTIVPEAQASGHASGTSTTLTQMVMSGYLYSSKVIKISWQELRDSALDIESKLGALLGQRLARAQNTHFTSSGTGSGMPQSLTGKATVGRQSAVGNTTSVPFDDVYKTLHSVDVAYRTPACRWMFSDPSALTLRLAKDGNGRYLWPEMGSVQAGQPATLAGYPFVINNDMPAMAASAKWASFGDHSYYKIRRVRGISFVRINELYVESGMVGFLAFQSADGGYANPGQDPIKLLQNSAT